MSYITQRELIKGRKDLSPFLIHLTRDGQYVRYADVNRLQGERLALSARSSFESILTNNMLEARSAFGAFNLKVLLRRGDGTMTNPGSKVDRNWLLSVCFTETPLAQIHFQVKEVQAGNAGVDFFMILL